MKKFILLILAILFQASLSLADVNLPYSTSFIGCSADTNYTLDGWACGTGTNGVFNNVDSVSCDSTGIQVITAANYSGGAGGKGWRRWVCGAASGNSPTTGSMSIGFLTPQPEIWVRWYMRWQTGFQWNSSAGLGYQKVVYIRPFGSGCVMDLLGADGMGLGCQSDGMGGHIYSATSAGWNTMNPKGTNQSNGVNLGDNSWHCIEFHFKNESAQGKRDGVWDLWIDGVQKIHQTGITVNATGWDAGVQNLQFMINQATPSNPKPMYNDIDDIAISSKGYIGPIGKPIPPPPPPAGPVAPKGFIVK